MTGECGTETHQVGAAITLWDVVGKTQQVFVEAIVPLHGNFDANTVFFTVGGEMKHLVDGGLVGVEVLDKRFESPLILEQLFLAGALIFQTNANSRVKEREFAQALGQCFPDKLNVLECVG